MGEEARGAVPRRGGLGGMKQRTYARYVEARVLLHAGTRVWRVSVVDCPAVGDKRGDFGGSVVLSKCMLL